MKWGKASYGGTASKSGGGKLQPLITKGDRGIPPGSSVPKASVSRGGSVIDAPGEKGDKGAKVVKGGHGGPPIAD